MVEKRGASASAHGVYHKCLLAVQPLLNAIIGFKLDPEMPHFAEFRVLSILLLKVFDSPVLRSAKTLKEFWCHENIEKKNTFNSSSFHLCASIKCQYVIPRLVLATNYAMRQEDVDDVKVMLKLLGLICSSVLCSRSIVIKELEIFSQRELVCFVIQALHELLQLVSGRRLLSSSSHHLLRAKLAIHTKNEYYKVSGSHIYSNFHKNFAEYKLIYMEAITSLRCYIHMLQKMHQPPLESSDKFRLSEITPGLVSSLVYDSKTGAFDKFGGIHNYYEATRALYYIILDYRDSSVTSESTSLTSTTDLNMKENRPTCTRQLDVKSLVRLKFEPQEDIRKLLVCISIFLKNCVDFLFKNANLSVTRTKKFIKHLSKFSFLIASKYIWKIDTSYHHIIPCDFDLESSIFDILIIQLQYNNHREFKVRKAEPLLLQIPRAKLTDIFIKTLFSISMYDYKGVSSNGHKLINSAHGIHTTLLMLSEILCTEIYSKLFMIQELSKLFKYDIIRFNRLFEASASTFRKNKKLKFMALDKLASDTIFKAIAGSETENIFQAVLDSDTFDFADSIREGCYPFYEEVVETPWFPSWKCLDDIKTIDAMKNLANALYKIFSPGDFLGIIKGFLELHFMTMSSTEFSSALLSEKANCYLGCLSLEYLYLENLAKGYQDQSQSQNIPSGLIQVTSFSKSEFEKTKSFLETIWSLITFQLTDIDKGGCWINATNDFSTLFIHDCFLLRSLHFKIWHLHKFFRDIISTLALLPKPLTQACSQATNLCRKYIQCVRISLKKNIFKCFRKYSHDHAAIRHFYRDFLVQMISFYATLSYFDNHKTISAYENFVANDLLLTNDYLDLLNFLSDQIYLDIKSSYSLKPTSCEFWEMGSLQLYSLLLACRTDNANSSLVDVIDNITTRIQLGSLIIKLKCLPSTTKILIQQSVLKFVSFLTAVAYKIYMMSFPSDCLIDDDERIQPLLDFNETTRDNKFRLAVIERIFNCTKRCALSEINEISYLSRVGLFFTLKMMAQSNALMLPNIHKMWPALTAAMETIASASRSISDVTWLIILLILEKASDFLVHRFATEVFPYVIQVLEGETARLKRSSLHDKLSGRSYFISSNMLSYTNLLRRSELLIKILNLACRKSLLKDSLVCHCVGKAINFMEFHNQANLHRSAVDLFRICLETCYERCFIIVQSYLSLRQIDFCPNDETSFKNSSQNIYCKLFQSETYKEQLKTELLSPLFSSEQILFAQATCFYGVATKSRISLSILRPSTERAPLSQLLSNQKILPQVEQANECIIEEIRKYTKNRESR